MLKRALGCDLHARRRVAECARASRATLVRISSQQGT